MASESTFWLIWNPATYIAPTKRFSSEAQVKAVARSMATRFPGDRFYVLKASDFYETHTITHGCSPKPQHTTCDGCGLPIYLTASWTLWPWPDGKWLCDRCNDARHDTDEYDEVSDG